MSPSRPPVAVVLPVVVAVVLLGVAACSDQEEASGGGEGGRPAITVTTNILGDVVSQVVGDTAVVTVVMPVGADPHDFQPSAREAAAMRDADLLIVNGGGFEESLLDVVGGAEADGVPVHEAIDGVDVIDLAEGGDGHDGVDPHFFTDPSRMIRAVAGIVAAVVGAAPEIDEAALRASAEAYVGQLEVLDTEVEAALAPVPSERRVLVTNHEVFGYFADRYGFEVVGTIVPGRSTSGGASAGALADLVDVVVQLGVPAIFADTSSPADLADTLAEEVGDVEVVELFSESLGEVGSGGATYLEMVRTNAERIAGALA